MPAADRANQSRDRFRGFGLGTAILTAQQLKDVHTRLNQAFSRLNDPTISGLQEALKSRLEMAGIDVENLVPLRAFANRSIIEHDKSFENNQTLVNESHLRRVEEAILERKQVKLKVPDTKDKGKGKEIQVWPLQILFHNIGWYLAYESAELGSLLTVTRLDRIQLINAGLPQQRSLAEMKKSQQRLEHLCRRTGGIFLGDDHHQQKKLAVDDLSEARIQALLHEGTLVKVRFHCSARIYSFIRSGNKRYPPEQMRLSGPLPTDDWTVGSAGAPLLDPDPTNTTHPYPVEIILPAWTVKSNDFRSWLFGFGGDLKIESPDVLSEEHHAYGRGIAALYETPNHTNDEPSGFAAS
jgi:predicted DNA-binding transcriptional regulator YafY